CREHRRRSATAARLRDGQRRSRLNGQRAYAHDRANQDATRAPGEKEPLHVFSPLSGAVNPNRSPLVGGDSTSCFDRRSSNLDKGTIKPPKTGESSAAGPPEEGPADAPNGVAS